MTTEEQNLSSDVPASIIFGCLVVTLQGELYPETLDKVEKEVLETVYTSTLNGVIFDMSAVRILDSYSFNFLVKIVKSIKLLGMEAVFCSLQPGVVSSLVDLDVDIEGFQSFLSIEDSLHYMGVNLQKDITDNDEDDEEEYREEEEETCEDEEI